MKTRNLFLSLFAFAAICACNKEVVPTVQDTLDGDAYIAVNIVTSDDAFTKADEGDYVSGTETPVAENAVNTINFLFFQDGTLVKKSTPTFTNWSGPDNADPDANIEKMSEAVVVLDKNDPLPNQLLVILNASGYANGLTVGTTTLSQVLAKYDDYSDPKTNGFIMTNSVYATDATGAVVNNVTKINPAEHLKATEAAAKASPVKVYVERVNSKVVVKKGPSYVDHQNFEVDGNPITLRHKVLGFAVTPEINKSYLVKNITGISNGNDSDNSTGYWDKWNDKTNFRSYWAVNPVLVDDDVEINATATFTDADDNYTAVWEATDNTYADYVYYPQENVSQTANPKLIVVAQIEEETTPGNWTAYTAYSYAGKWYTESNLLSMAQNALLAAGQTFSSSDLEIVAAGAPAKDYEVKIKFADETGKPDVAKDVLANLGNAKKWEDGKCYFFVDIEHFGTHDGNLLKGFVRNHQYEITINSISGWGTPGDLGIGGGDPEDPIIPEEPEDESYVAATINILKWKVVSQNVDLK